MSSLWKTSITCTLNEHNSSRHHNPESVVAPGTSQRRSSMAATGRPRSVATFRSSRSWSTITVFGTTKSRSSVGMSITSLRTDHVVAPDAKELKTAPSRSLRRRICATPSLACLPPSATPLRPRWTSVPEVVDRCKRMRSGFSRTMGQEFAHGRALDHTVRCGCNYDGFWTPEFECHLQTCSTGVGHSAIGSRRDDCQRHRLGFGIDGSEESNAFCTHCKAQRDVLDERSRDNVVVAHEHCSTHTKARVGSVGPGASLGGGDDESVKIHTPLCQKCHCFRGR